MKLFVLSVAALLSVSVIAQKKHIKGVVYIDNNTNGIFDKGDKGLTGVAVSNTRDVVLTNNKGEYKLSNISGEFISVTKPAAYQFAKDSLGYGIFYKALTQGELRDINFPVYKSDEDRTIQALLIGDPQMADKPRLDFYRDGSVNHMMRQQADFFMVLGDIADDDPQLLLQEKALMAQLGIDGYHVAGNHDANYESTEANTHFSTFKKTYGPDYYSYNYADAHFVVLNNINYLGWNQKDDKRGSYFGDIDEQQLTWLKNDLATVSSEKLIVINTHIPLLSNYMDTTSIKAVHALLEPFDNILALSGHLHGVKAYDNDALTLWKGKGHYESLVVGAASGSWWTGPYTEEELPFATCMDGTPKGYFMLELEGAKYSYRFIPELYPDDYQMRICIPELTSDQRRNDAEVIVNWFVGKNTDELRMSIDGEEPVKMERYKGFDPFIEATLSKRENLDNWTPGIAKTEHLWKAPLSFDLEPGYHTISVKALQKDGRVYQAKKVFEVE